MPPNSAEYQRSYRAETKHKRRVVSVCVSVPEHEWLCRYARAHRLTLSAFLRKAGLAQGL